MQKSEIKENVYIKDSKLHPSVFIAPGSHIIGDVTIEEDSSIWYNTVARADINQIKIGKRSNIQDNSVLHLENDQGVFIGNDVTIGHNAVIHGCTISDACLIGMGSIIMNGAIIGKGSVIGAGAVVKENMVVPDYSLVVGIPGKIIKNLNSNTYDQNIKWARKYVQLADIHKKYNQI